MVVLLTEKQWVLSQPPASNSWRPPWIYQPAPATGFCCSRQNIKRRPLTRHSHWHKKSVTKHFAALDSCLLCMVGGGSAGPERRFTYLSPMRLTSISLFIFALSLPNCFCSMWRPSLNMGRFCLALEQSITGGAKEQQVWQPLETSTAWNWVLLLENSRSETKIKWMILLEQSATMLLCCEIICTVSERTVLKGEEGMNHIYPLFNST